MDVEWAYVPCSTIMSGHATLINVSGCMTLQDTLLAFGQLVVNEQENVRRVQLANEYLNSAALAGRDGSSMPAELVR